MVSRHAGYEKDTISDRCDFGMHTLVRGVSVELPTSRRDDGRARVSVDHSTINRLATRFLPIIEKFFRQHKRPVGAGWRMHETYIKVKGAWRYLYRAVDKEG